MTAATAPLAPPVQLPITSFYQIVADPAQGYLFISTGSELMVTNLAGQEVTILDSGADVTGIALSADGSTLYAALSSDLTVVAIDTATLDQTASYRVGGGATSLADVAVQSGKVWVSYNTSIGPFAAIGDINLSADPPGFETQAAMGNWYAAPELAADPQDSGILVASYDGESAAPYASYNVSTDPATLLSSTTEGQDCGYSGDLAVVPGGSQFIISDCTDDDEGAAVVLSTADLSLEGSYPSGNSVAIDTNGDVAIGGQGYGGIAEISVFEQGASVPVNTYSQTVLGEDGYGGGVAYRGLAWDPDGSQLFAVEDNGAPDEPVYALQVISNPTLVWSSLSLSGPSTADIGQSVTLTGSLALGTGEPPDETPITITRTGPGSSTQTFSATTAADGSFSLTDTPPAFGQYTYTATYGGDATTESATASQTVTVTPVPATLTLSGPSTAFIGQSVTLTGSLTLGTGEPPAQTPITITRTGPGSTSQTFSATTAADGSFSLTDTPPSTGQYTYSAAYAGNATTAAATASQAVTVTLITATLTLGGPSSALIGHSFTLHGSINLSVGALPTGTAITITRTVAGGTSTRTFNLATDASGSFTLTDTPPSTGQYTYTASYAGNSTTAPATTSDGLTVDGLPVALRVTASGPASTSYESAVHITAYLGTTYRNRSVSIYAQSFGSTARALIKTGRVNSRGELTASFRPRYSTKFIAVFTGDARYSAETASVSVQVRVNVIEKISGYYATQTSGGTTYRLYHHTGVLHVMVTVEPNKAGQCVVLQIQQYYDGGWHQNQKFSCGHLGTASKAAGNLGLSQAGTGTTYRIRFEYLGGSRDHSNLDNDSAWQYFKVQQ